MKIVTRQPCLLVKMPEPAQLSFSLEKSNYLLEPLMPSVDHTMGLGLATAPKWFAMTPETSGDEVNAWDLCYRLLTQGFGVAAMPSPQFAEPDFEQQWIFGTEIQQAIALTRAGDIPDDPDPRYPRGDGYYWFRDKIHSQLEDARDAVGKPPEKDRVRIAHLDTGYDPKHSTIPQFLDMAMQRNFVDKEYPYDATDRSTGAFKNLGHGTGTLGILAGKMFDGALLGGAPHLSVVPVRVANSVVLFWNSTIAKALDYVHSQFDDPKKRMVVITMSMGGLASQAWADAVNALYEQGVFIVTAAGNNFGNLPTRNIVFPARFNRVTAACGVMADGSPYADLPIKQMAGNYGPEKKMRTALAAYTPNTPWARFGCSQIVDRNGNGTSSATPQVAAAAALWIQKNKNEWGNYKEGWMRVEAVRKALFDSAALDKPEKKKWLGRGVLHANDALAQKPAAPDSLKKEKTDSASFSFLRVLTGLGIDSAADPRQQMFELETLQLTQKSIELEDLISRWPESPEEIPIAERQRFVDALIEAPDISDSLRTVLKERYVPTKRSQVAVPSSIHSLDKRRLTRALNPPIPTPTVRSLRVFACDPSLGLNLETMGVNETTLDVLWENDLGPGPVGEYLEVIDIDPASGCAYMPVDLNHPHLLSQAGLDPSESNPQFHQQMAYAVAMKTIQQFERALGRVALWSPRIVRSENRIREEYVQRLRIYPHALRAANSLYCPDTKSLLFGYFPASQPSPGNNLPGGSIFCCLSHDIVAHETTHALLDGLHRRFQDPSNKDVLAFHEAFADIVALFQHFTVSEFVRNQIAKTQGDLRRQNLLGELALQFGQATGRYGALRSAIGGYDAQGEWQFFNPTPKDYEKATESHERGAILVAAVFNAFLDIYRSRTEDLLRLATNGTGILPPGAIPNDLLNRLTREAAKTASHVLAICIRALDYCPPEDITFGDYLRALITADLDLAPDDRLGYRIAFIQAFQRRGIYPESVLSLSVKSLCWERPEVFLPMDTYLNKIKQGLWGQANRRYAYNASRENAFLLHEWFKSNVRKIDAESLGFSLDEEKSLTVNGVSGSLSKFEVHSVRPMQRIGPDYRQRMDIVVEITQSWIPEGREGTRYRGGCTLLIDLETLEIRYCVRKRVGHPGRIQAQKEYRAAMAESPLVDKLFRELDKL